MQSTQEYLTKVKNNEFLQKMIILIVFSVLISNIDIVGQDMSMRVLKSLVGYEFTFSKTATPFSGTFSVASSENITSSTPHDQLISSLTSSDFGLVKAASDEIYRRGNSEDVKAVFQKVIYPRFDALVAQVEKGNTYVDKYREYHEIISLGKILYESKDSSFYHIRNLKYERNISQSLRDKLNIFVPLFIGMGLDVFYKNENEIYIPGSVPDIEKCLVFYSNSYLEALALHKNIDNSYVSYISINYKIALIEILAKRDNSFHSPQLRECINEIIQNYSTDLFKYAPVILEQVMASFFENDIADIYKYQLLLNIFKHASPQFADNILKRYPYNYADINLMRSILYSRRYSHYDYKHDSGDKLANYRNAIITAANKFNEYHYAAAYEFSSADFHLSEELFKFADFISKQANSLVVEAREMVYQYNKLKFDTPIGLYLILRKMSLYDKYNDEYKSGFRDSYLYHYNDFKQKYNSKKISSHQFNTNFWYVFNSLDLEHKLLALMLYHDIHLMKKDASGNVQGQPDKIELAFFNQYLQQTYENIIHCSNKKNIIIFSSFLSDIYFKPEKKITHRDYLFKNPNEAHLFAYKLLNLAYMDRATGADMEFWKKMMESKTLSKRHKDSIKRILNLNNSKLGIIDFNIEEYRGIKDSKEKLKYINKNKSMTSGAINVVINERFKIYSRLASGGWFNKNVDPLADMDLLVAIFNMMHSHKNMSYEEIYAEFLLNFQEPVKKFNEMLMEGNLNIEKANYSTFSLQKKISDPYKVLIKMLIHEPSLLSEIEFEYETAGFLKSNEYSKGLKPYLDKNFSDALLCFFKENNKKDEEQVYKVLNVAEKLYRYYSMSSFRDSLSCLETEPDPVRRGEVIADYVRMFNFWNFDKFVIKRIEDKEYVKSIMKERLAIVGLSDFVYSFRSFGAIQDYSQYEALAEFLLTSVMEAPEENLEFMAKITRKQMNLWDKNTKPVSKKNYKLFTDIVEKIEAKSEEYRAAVGNVEAMKSYLTLLLNKTEISKEFIQEAQLLILELKDAGENVDLFVQLLFLKYAKYSEQEDLYDFEKFKTGSITLRSKVYKDKQYLIEEEEIKLNLWNRTGMEEVKFLQQLTLEHPETYLWTKDHIGQVDENYKAELFIKAINGLGSEDVAHSEDCFEVIMAIIEKGWDLKSIYTKTVPSLSIEERIEIYSNALFNLSVNHVQKFSALSFGFVSGMIVELEGKNGDLAVLQSVLDTTAQWVVSYLEGPKNFISLIETIEKENPQFSGQKNIENFLKTIDKQYNNDPANRVKIMHGLEELEESLKDTDHYQKAGTLLKKYRELELTY